MSQISYFEPRPEQAPLPKPRNIRITKEQVQQILDNQTLCQAWVAGISIQFQSGRGDWVDIDPNRPLAFNLSIDKYRVKPVDVVRWAVYNTKPENVGDKPYFLCDFPSELAASDYIVARPVEKQWHLKVVPLRGQVA